jgi:phospholipid/cholesterol/gamma-HCH transport system substrate-binding protein
VKLETRVGLFILAAIGVFLYLSINIRAIRLDKDQYFSYKAYFDDISGLAIKAPIKIAGVEVGWVEKIDLLEDGKAELVMRIGRHVRLAKNAFAMIHQDGLIGTKTLEIDPGDPSTGFLVPGSTLAMPGKTPASVGELLDQFRDIASTIQDIASSVKNVVGTRLGEERMRTALHSVSKASERIADFSEVLLRTIHNNEQNINSIIADLRATIPAAKHSVEKFGSAADNISDAAIQGRDTFREAGEVCEKINNGKGVIGKLVNEDETYTDLRKTIRGFKDYVGKTQSLMLNIDMHSETMLRNTNSKGYFELRLRPNSDYFYLFQLVGAEFGAVSREIIYKTRMDDKGNVLHASQMNIPLERKLEFPDVIARTVQRKFDVLFGLQFGKRFDRLAFRLGMFESTFGAAVDYYVPLPTDKLHWITTVEGFDFRGVNRIHDTRPHVKWLNRLFFMKNFYTSFGVDDMVSKRSANPFLGGGLRFGDDDLKYYLSFLPLGKAGGSR